MTKIRTRFAPSPTGALHIGGARTALYNWLYARANDGEFLLRIEDTDRARSTEENTRIILDSLDWLGLDFDGEPISQFARADRHAAVAHELVKKGAAYYCYTSPEELQELRSAAEAKKEFFKYPHIWRDKTESDAPKGVKPVIRIKAPLEGESTVIDIVQGSVTIPSKEIEDFVILRSDGTPTYLLSVVVDDHDMEISHVIRGDDHLTNTFKQKLIYEAMEWKLPVFSHVPLIHGPDGKKMSKRHGATGTDEYRAMGILPEAMRNYLMRLGWGYEDEEIISTERALEIFDIEDIGRAPARFDLEKLLSVNGHYLRAQENDALIQMICPMLEKDFHVTDQAKIWMLKGMDDLKERASTLPELAEIAKIYVQMPPFDMDENTAALVTEINKKTLDLLAKRLEHLDPFESELIDSLCKRMSEEENIKMKDIMMPFRAALTGRSQSPHLAKISEVLGKAETLSRIAIFQKT